MDTPTLANRPSRPAATVTIEPTGRRTASPREQLITMLLELSSIDEQHAQGAWVEAVVRRALDELPLAPGDRDRRKISPATAAIPGKAGGPRGSITIGVEGSMVCASRPGNDAIERLRQVLIAAGYRVDVREHRECARAGCGSATAVDFRWPLAVPDGWFSDRICGKHGYRSCPRCDSIYLLANVSSNGQAGPSVHCEVCGGILIEWGSSKVWTAELVSRGDKAPVSKPT